MLHEARQTFIHEEAKKLREKLNIEINTPESFFIVKEILDRYDNASKLHQPTVSICACGSNEYYVEQYKDVTKYYCKSCGEKISKH